MKKNTCGHCDKEIEAGTSFYRFHSECLLDVRFQAIREERKRIRKLVLEQSAKIQKSALSLLLLIDWNKWKDNFCQHISDWSYYSANDELEKMRSIIRSQAIEETRREIRDVVEKNIRRIACTYRSVRTAEDVESVIDYLQRKSGHKEHKESGELQSLSDLLFHPALQVLQVKEEE